jgi:hypothetical protein
MGSDRIHSFSSLVVFELWLYWTIYNYEVANNGGCVVSVVGAHFFLGECEGLQSSMTGIEIFPTAEVQESFWFGGGKTDVEKRCCVNAFSTRHCSRN